MTIPVFIVGPSKIGKTWISNHLADISESLNSNYHETIGVRILEISKKIKGINLDVELWDISGNPKFHSLISGITSEAAALIYVTNNSDSKIWESLFSHLSPTQVLIISFKDTSSLNSWKNSSTLNDFSFDDSNLVKLKSEFDKFLLNIYQIQQEKKEKEESLIVGS